jgi:superfamily II DNA or RNA helicase
MAFEEMEFRHSWRGYQARVLRDLENHLDDAHLHVVAAPGSGKTVLGLEVMRRLSRPTLILAPSLAIRNQWAQRIAQLFLEEGADTSWISTQLREPALVTVSTYQSLHAAWTGGAEEDTDGEEWEEEDGDESGSPGGGEAILRTLKSAGIQTLILDEAHHLRSEWWKVLVQTKEAFESMTTVSLTATPPYDVESKEWDRYEELCGPIDTLISVPELVEKRDLCPHQDYVCFSLPTELEKETLEEFRSSTRTLAKSLIGRVDFVRAMAQHSWVTNTAAHTEEILSDPLFFSSLLVFLHGAKQKVPSECLSLLGAKAAEIPHVNETYLQVLLTGFLYQRVDEFPATDEMRAELIRELKQMGAIERRKVTLANPKAVKKLLATSMSKLDSVVEIARMESRVLGESLRMVILSDYIRQSEMPTGTDEVQGVSKMGVVPLFETLRRAEIVGLKLGVLTGSLVVIPTTEQDQLTSVALAAGFGEDAVRFAPLEYTQDYVEVSFSGAAKQHRVKLFTEFFTQGGVNTLVGTQALLGEGWDAPVVNTLILASFVGSYMLSNQMRGRAIRIHAGRPQKTANIWHLVAVDNVLSPLRHLVTDDFFHPAQDLGDPFDPIGYDLGLDMEMLKRRFRSFEGPSRTFPCQIQNGVGRLGLPQGRWTTTTAKKASQDMLDSAADRAGMAGLWEDALVTGNPTPMVWEQVETDRPPRPFLFHNTLALLLAMILFLGGLYLEVLATALHGMLAEDPTRWMDIWFWVAAFVYVLICLLCCSRWIVPALRIVLFNGSLEGNVRQVGRAVLESLHEVGTIRTRLDGLKVEVGQDKDSSVISCRLSGGTHKEEQSFLQALEECLSPVDNPRYLLIRYSRFLWWARTDYHAVPKVLGGKKEDAIYFAKKFHRYVGQARCVYTRTLEGREWLLKSRTHAMSAQFVKRAHRRRVWQ